MLGKAREANRITRLKRRKKKSPNVPKRTRGLAESKLKKNL